MEIVINCYLFYFFMKNSHVIYSDESNQTSSKFGSVCLVSGSNEDIFLLEMDLKNILEDSDVREFKFNKINSGKMVHCGIKIIDKVIEFISNYNIRVDIIIWSTDERSKILPDKSKIVFEKMYYHLLNNVLGSRWDTSLKWNIFPDIQSLIDWQKMKDILENTGMQIKINKTEEGGHLYEIICKNNICKIEEVCSKEKVICQIADLFAGIGSSAQLNKSNLILHDEKQKNLDNNNLDLSLKDIGKIRIINHLKKCCKNKEFKIEFSPSKGIRTLNPQTPINFWVFKHRMQQNKNKNLVDWF